MSSDIEDFKNSGQTVTAAKLVGAVESVKKRLHNAWEFSASEDEKLRDDLYRQIRGLDSGLIELIRELK